LAALYSGGKDSTMSAYVALQMGHEIACLVSILPEDSGSWIFHTPNLDVVPLISESMGIPLVSAPSTGTEEGDMEALAVALEGLDVEGVVTGALWSDYQWDRINMVCGDLGLKVLSPLWRKDQDMLLDEMISAGISAVIVGCYAEGLGRSWLGRPIDAAAAEDLRALRSRYGISVMGEGGEYESLTLDSPMHSRPLVITESEVVWKKDSGTLHVRASRLGSRREAGEP